VSSNAGATVASAIKSIRRSVALPQRAGMTRPSMSAADPPEPRTIADYSREIRPAPNRHLPVLVPQFVIHRSPSSIFDREMVPRYQ
jgi:hypothetical protein